MTPDGNLTRIALRPEPSAGSARLLGPSSLVSTITHYVPDAPRLASLKRLTRRLAQVAVPGLFLSLAACGGNMEEPKVQINPNPTSQYRLYITIEKSPRSFDAIDGLASYQIPDESCLPRVKFSGARRAPSGAVPISIQKISDIAMETKVAKDGLLDEDYYGLGVCHWHLVAFSVRLRINQTTFSTPVFSEQMVDGNVIKGYFPNRGFESTLSGFDIPASADPHSFPDPEATFNVTIRVEGASK